MLRYLLPVAIAAGVCGTAQAETSPKDVQVAVRTLRFLAEKPAEPVRIAIVHTPANPASLAEAEALMRTLGAGSISGVAVEPVMMTNDALESLASVRLAFVTAGTAGRAAVFAATRSAGVLSVSTDAGCAEAGECVMSVQAEPKVKIVVNSAAAKASGVEFKPTFRMMISEI